MFEFIMSLSEDERQILQCALYEYIAQRGPTPEAYVSRRYDCNYHDEKWLAEKVENVRRNLKLAEEMRQRSFNLEAQEKSND